MISYDYEFKALDWNNFIKKNYPFKILFLRRNVLNIKLTKCKLLGRLLGASDKIAGFPGPGTRLREKNKLELMLTNENVLYLKFRPLNWGPLGMTSTSSFSFQPYFILKIKLSLLINFAYYNKCGTNIYFFYSTEVWSITINKFLNLFHFVLQATM